jgi:uncharacterized protein (TIRG00374 family)
VTQPERGRRGLQLGLALVISALLVWYAFRKVDIGEVWHDVRTAALLPLLGSVVVATLSFPLRVPRWRLLLRADDGSRVPAAPLWHAIAIGFAANNTLPFRAGEILRGVAISRTGRVRFATALSSIAVERVFDALVAIGLFAGALLTAHLPPTTTIAGTPVGTRATQFGVICLALLLAAMLAAWQRAFALRVLDRLLPRGALGEHARHFAERLLEGLTALHDPRRALPIVGWSVVIWVVNAAGFWIGYRAFGIHAPFTSALILQGALLIVIAAPQMPGFIGTFEAVIPATLALYGVDAERGLAYALTYHVATFIPITLFGAWYAVRSGVTLKSADEATA